MTESKTTQRFRATLKRFLDSDRKTRPRSAVDRAAFFVDSKEPALCRSFLLAEVERFINIEDRKSRDMPKNPEEEAQLRFLGEDFSGLFSGPRHLLPLKNGGRREMQKLTIMQLRQSATSIRSRISPRASQQAAYLESLADRMSPYSRTHPGLTLGAFLQLALDGIIVERKRT